MLSEKLAAFLEPGARPAFPLSRGSEFGRRAAEIFHDATREAVEAGGTGFELETNVNWSRAVAALRARMTCEVIGAPQQEIARRVGTTPESFSRIINEHVPVPYAIEQALYRELLFCAIVEWVSGWEIPEARAEFEAAYLANPIDFGGYALEADPDHGLPAQDVRGESITDNFGRALYALGAVCGAEGWRDFWKAVGRHIFPIPPYEGSAQYFTQRLKEQRKRAGNGPETGEE